MRVLLSILGRAMAAQREETLTTVSHFVPSGIRLRTTLDQRGENRFAFGGDNEFG
jgi:hypothetical protein